MARARNIKPGFFKNADLAELGFEVRLLFIGLWTLADRSGRLEDRPKQIKMELFAADSVDCDAMLAQLVGIQAIDRYEVEGKRFIQVVNFEKHQNPHRDEKSSAIPDRSGTTAEAHAKPTKRDASTVQTLCKGDANTVAIGLIPSLLIPDPLIPDSPKEKDTHTPLRGDWVLPKAWGEWVITSNPHWTPEVVRTVAERFAAHFHSKATTSADWLATWQLWCTDPLTQKAHAPPKTAPKPVPAVALTVPSKDGKVTQAFLAERARSAAEDDQRTPEQRDAMLLQLRETRQRMKA